jgi:hypothetical protein
MFQRIIFTILLFTSTTSWADGPCPDLLSNRLGELDRLEQQPAQHSVIISNSILRGKTNPWLFWQERNPWIPYEGKRVLVVAPATKFGEEPLLSFQNVMSLENFNQLIPEVKNHINEILNLSKKSGWEWGFAVYVLRDREGKLHLVHNATPFTSADPGAIHGATAVAGISAAAEDAKSVVKILAAPDEAAWEVVEMWMVHTHPGLYSTLSRGDVGAAEFYYKMVGVKSLRLRMIAVTVKDPTVFSITLDPETDVHKFSIHKEDGWSVQY